MSKTVVEYAGEVTFLPNATTPLCARFAEVYGHPRFPDGKSVTSSKIVAVGGDVIETLNTIYKPRQGVYEQATDD